MSVYSTIQGVVVYPSKEALDKVVNMLVEGKWMQDGCFLDERGVKETKNCVNVSNLEIVIPCNLYRNLCGMLDQMIKDSNDYYVVWTSTDGMFLGGILDSEARKENLYDLDVYAKKLPMSKPDENDFQKVCEWMRNVEKAFFEEFELD